MFLETNNENQVAYFNDLQTALTGLALANYTSKEYNINSNLLTFISYRQHSVELATFLKLHSSCLVDTAIDCVAIDSLNSKYRFTITYMLHSSLGNIAYNIITKTNDIFPLISLQSIYPAFNWAEREIWDLSGIIFIKHPDLRRILTDYGFIGHPLRKDFPLSGFREIHYEDSTKHIEYTDVELPQNFRNINALSPWQNA